MSGFTAARYSCAACAATRPFADQFIATVSGGEENDVRRAVGLLRDGLSAAVKNRPMRIWGLEVIGPAPAPVVRINGSYRYRLLLLGENNAQVRGLLSSFMRAFAQKAGEPAAAHPRGLRPDGLIPF